MQRIFVDTSAWVALFVINDINHVKAASVFDDLKSGRAIIYTSDYVVDETITTILARGGKRQSIIAGNALLASDIAKIVSVSLEYFQQTWEAYQKYKDKAFSFTDVSSFVIMKKLGINKAFSFDREFTQAGVEVIG